MAEIDSLKNIDKDLLKELECPICMEYMKPPIVMCENGHSICNICKQKLKQCPTCRKPFTNVRNLALESLSSITLTSTEETDPSLKGYKCPFSKISNEECTWSGRLKNMKKHIRTSHNNPNDAHVSEGNFNVILTGFSPTRHYRKAQLIHQEVFYVFWAVKDGQFYCAALNIGSESNASNFKYTFSITSKNGLKNISMTFPTKSVIEDLNKIMKPGECVFLHYDTVVEFLDPNKILSCDFEISPVGATSVAGISTFKTETKCQKTIDSSKKTESSGNRGTNEMHHEQNFDPDFSRGRGGRFPRRSRGRWNWSRGRRGFPDMHPSGPLGLFSEGNGNLTKGTKLGWSLSDLRDETYYQDETSPPVKKTSSAKKEKSATKESNLRSQVDNMSNDELRELIIKTMEDKFSSQTSSSSSQGEYSEARRPSVSSQKSTYSGIHSLPKEDILKLITKSFNDKPSVDTKASSETKKTSISSPRTQPNASNASPFEYSSLSVQTNHTQKFTNEKEKASVMKMDQALFSDEKLFSKSSSNISSGSSCVGKTGTNIYPTNLLENLTKSSEGKPPDPKNFQSVLPKPGGPLSPVQTHPLSKPSTGSYVFKETVTKPTAPNVKSDLDIFWLCTLCNNLVPKNNVGNQIFFKPAGTTWFCKLCEHWRP